MQDTTPKISVIVPLYNREKFLPQLYATLDAQTFKDFEVILIDDGSTDNTQQWLQEHALAHGQDVIYRHQENAGPYVARNYGLSLAKGQYIAFQDSDDEWPNYHLDEFVKALDEHSDIDWLFGSLQRIDHDTKEIKEASNFTMADGSRHPFVNLHTEQRNGLSVINDQSIKTVAIKHCVPGSTQCALIRKSVFEKNVFDGTYRTAYDRFYAIKSVLRGHKFAFVDTTHQIYHIHDAHISLVTDVNPEKVKRSANTMLRGYSALLPLTHSKQEVVAVKNQLARVNAWELSIALKDLGQLKESSSAMLQAWQLAPTNWRYAKSYLVSLVRICIAPLGMKL
ncbi:MAG: glycosyltransferase family 2 protein [Paraglaciecola sp.]|uniref:glycosyltransferase family 2 protein n=3 Tax=Paraglaciecola sp. TaxID=1920173 RepID=UPI0032658F98